METNNKVTIRKPILLDWLYSQPKEISLEKLGQLIETKTNTSGLLHKRSDSQGKLGFKQRRTSKTDFLYFFLNVDLL